jgi:hypothetical protein
MRPMKDCAYSVERNTHAGSLALADFGPLSDKHCFNISPNDTATNWIIENCQERSPMLLAHYKVNSIIK